MSADDPVTNCENYKAGLFYYNPEDDRILIRVSGTASRYIINYARWPIYIIIVPVILVVCYAVIARMLG